MNIINLPQPLSFEWDRWNKDKILNKHGVSSKECEEVFESQDLFIQPDILHSEIEDRYMLIGHSNTGQYLFVIFTIRGNIVRVISARRMHKKEIKSYEEKTNLTKI